MPKTICFAGLFVLLAVASPRAQPVKPFPLRVVGLEYPRLANLAHVQGNVELKAIITGKGDVSSIQVLSGHELLARAARETAVKWKYTSCTGTRPCEATLMFSFELTGPCDHSECGTEFQVDLPNQVSVKARLLPPMIN